MVALRELLNRYKGRSVSVQSHGYRRYIGKLAMITDEFIVLQNSSAFDDYEGSRWQDEQTHWNIKEGIEVGFAETAIALGAISAVTSSDNEGLDPVEKLEADDDPAPSAEPIEESQGPAIHQVELLIGSEIGKFMRENFHLFSEKIDLFRDAFRADFCFDFPRIRCRDWVSLSDDQYSIVVNGTPRAGGRMIPEHYAAIGPEEKLRTLSDEIFIEPYCDLPAVWIASSELEKCQLLGLMCVESLTVLEAHVRHIVSLNVAELFSFEATQEIVRYLAKYSPSLHYEFFSGYSSRLRLHDVLLGLLEEGVKLHAIDKIVEAVGLAGGDSVAEHVDQTRQRIVHCLLKSATNPYGQATRVMLSSEIVDELPQILATEELLERFKVSLRSFAAKHRLGLSLVLVVPAECRRDLAISLGRLRSEYVVLSHEEFRSARIGWQSIDFGIESFCGLEEHRPSQSESSLK